MAGQPKEQHATERLILSLPSRTSSQDDIGTFKPN